MDSVLIIGIGSPHADDVAGWRVVQQLEQRWLKLVSRPKTRVHFHCAAVPHDILDWIESGQSLHLVDACVVHESDPPSLQAPIGRWQIRCSGQSLFVSAVQADGGFVSLHTGRVSRFEELDSKRDEYGFRMGHAPELRSNSSHQFDLWSVLELAAALGKLPEESVLWTVAVESGDYRAGIAAATRSRIAECVDLIYQEIGS